MTWKHRRLNYLIACLHISLKEDVSTTIGGSHQCNNNNTSVRWIYFTRWALEYSKHWFTEDIHRPLELILGNKWNFVINLISFNKKCFKTLKNIFKKVYHEIKNWKNREKLLKICKKLTNPQNSKTNQFINILKIK